MPSNDLQIAIEHHQAGRLAHAEPIYRQFLATQPQHDGVLHLLGVLNLQSQRYDVAVDLLRQAIAVQPNAPNYHRHLGAALYALRRLDEAIAAFRRLLALTPNDPDGHFQLGTLLSEVGRLDEAIACYQRTLARVPNHFEAHNNWGTALQHQGRLDEAIARFENAVSFNPNFASAHGNLGIALRAKGRLDDAIASCQRALALNPNLAIVHGALGGAYFDRGQVEPALASFQRATALEPCNADAHRGLGDALLDAGRPGEAIASYQQALALGANQALLHNNLGVALKKSNRTSESVACYLQALKVDPNFGEALSNLGNAYVDLDRIDEAIPVLERGLALGSDHPETLHNVGAALFQCARFEQAMAAFRRAIELKPDLAEAHMFLGLGHLAHGRLTEGWPEFEWRWKCAAYSAKRRDLRQPKWDGRPLDGRTIFLHYEWGLGDTLHLIRYAPMIARAGGKIVAECQPTLKRLMQESFPEYTWITDREPAPPFDVHCPLLGLPGVFGTTLATIPAPSAYVRPNADDVRRWRERLSDDAFEVGLAWAGDKRHSNDRRRSIALKTLAPLATVPGVRFFSLQKGEAAMQVMDPAVGIRVTDWTNDLHDVADTAALIANLDLVISVDTSVAHLAGAMGTTTWTLLPFVPDWRWLLEREDSPWYASMRLFRQPTTGDWRTVVEKMVEALASRAA